MALSDDLRQVVLLHYAEGMTPSDIARLNGEAPSTVTRRLDKARAQLRKHLESGLTTGLALLKPRPQQLQKTLALLAAAVALPAASHAQLLHLVADTPPPPINDPVTLAAQAAPIERIVLMKSFIVKLGAGKLVAWAAAAVVIGAGAYTVNSISNDSTESRGAMQATSVSTTRVAALDSASDAAAQGLTANKKFRANGSLPGRRAAASNDTAATNTEPRLAQGDTSTTPTEAAEVLVTVKGVVSDVTTSQPLANAIVRAVAPGQDMRYLRKDKDAKDLPSTRTDAAGAYELKVSLPVRAETLSLDAFSPGYRSLAGSWRMGGDFSKSNVPVSPGQTLRKNLDLPKALYVAGKVVDDEGNPVGEVTVSGSIASDRSEGGVAHVSTDPCGHFEIFDFPETSASANAPSVGRLWFMCDDRMTTTIPDIYQLPEAERGNLRVVMKTGLTLRGQLLEASGKPASGVKLHIKFGESGSYEQRAVTTDGTGNFFLRGLPEGKADLYAGSMELDQRLETELIVPTSGDITLSMVTTPYADTSNAVTLLGMTLIDVTPELKEKYDLDLTSGVLVLDPGTEVKRLGISGEKHSFGEGDLFCMAGMKHIANLEEFVSEVLRVNALPAPKGRVDEGYLGYVRVVYNFNRYRTNGSNTQYMKLTHEDVKELEDYLNPN